GPAPLPYTTLFRSGPVGGPGQQDRRDGCQGGEGRAKEHFAIFVGAHRRDDGLGQHGGLGMGQIHLPVGGYQGDAAHPSPASFTAKTSTPGRDRPSMYSKVAPPPVLIWSMASATPAWTTAAAESPPPTTTAESSKRATVRATATVPSAKAGHSNPPRGP